MEHVAHDGIEVGHEVAVAVAGDLTHPPAEGIYRLVDFVFLRVSQSAEVVERHVVGVILQCRLAEADDAVVVACLPYILQELYACGGIVGLYLEHTEQGDVDERVGHLLERHISGLEFCDIGCGLWHLQHLVEEGEHGDAVAAMVLAVGNDLPEDNTFAVDVGLRVEEQGLGMLHGDGVVFLLVIVVERHLCQLVVGLFLEHAVQFGERLLLLAVLQEPVAHHHPVLVVAGVLAGKFFQFVIFLFLVALHAVDPHLGEGDILRYALDSLQTLQDFYHLVVSRFLLVELQEQ